MSTFPRVIALGHQACVGKGEVAKHLVREHGFAQLNFATRLREVAVMVTGLPLSRFTTWKREPNPEWGGKTGAQILQDIGRAMRDAVHVDVWGRVVTDTIRRSSDTVRWVVEDLRYPSEVALLRGIGAATKFWRIIRPEELRGDIGRPKDHESEIALSGYDGWDAVIINDSTIDDLHAKVEKELAR